MKNMDMHCDVLYKMLESPDILFGSDPRLDVTYDRLKSAGMGVQAFAIFIPESWKGKPFDAVLGSIDLFNRRIAKHGGMLPIRTKKDLLAAMEPSEKRIGAMLTLEGAEGLEGNFTYLHMAWELGVRSLGITWNNANWAADGAREQRGGGFTAAGRKLIAECVSLGMTIDVSHLSDRGFWELTELTGEPFIASHSNLRALCNHPRNLTDDQAKAIIEREGRIGITFVPFFLREGGGAGVADVLRHLERICELGGARSVGFGSDFDGIEQWVKDLEHPAQLYVLKNELCKRYTSEQVGGFLGGNFHSYFLRALPDS